MLTVNPFGHLPTLSASKIKTYKQCPRKYYNESVLAKEDRPDQHRYLSTAMGSALHKTIELYYKGNKNYKYNYQIALGEEIDAMNEAGVHIVGLQWYGKYIVDGQKILDEFDWDRFWPLELERTFEIPFPNRDNPIVVIRGIIDLIDSRGFIIDHKSSKAIPTAEELSNDPQFILYYWAYEQIYGKPPEAMYWNHLRTNKLVKVDMTNVDEKLAQLEIDIVAMLTAVEYNRKPLDGFCINVCSFYKLCYPSGDE